MRESSWEAVYANNQTTQNQLLLIVFKIHDKICKSTLPIQSLRDELIEISASIPDAFNWRRQQDASEFAIWLITSIHQTINTGSGIRPNINLDQNVSKLPNETFSNYLSRRIQNFFKLVDNSDYWNAHASFWCHKRVCYYCTVTRQCAQCTCEKIRYSVESKILLNIDIKSTQWGIYVALLHSTGVISRTFLADVITVQLLRDNDWLKLIESILSAAKIQFNNFQINANNIILDNKKRFQIFLIKTCGPMRPFASYIDNSRSVDHFPSIEMFLDNPNFAAVAIQKLPDFKNYLCIPLSISSAHQQNNAPPGTIDRLTHAVCVPFFWYISNDQALQTKNIFNVISRLDTAIAPFEVNLSKCTIFLRSDNRYHSWSNVTNWNILYSHLLNKTHEVHLLRYLQSQCELMVATIESLPQCHVCIYLFLCIIYHIQYTVCVFLDSGISNMNQYHYNH